MNFCKTEGSAIRSGLLFSALTVSFSFSPSSFYEYRCRGVAGTRAHDTLRLFIFGLGLAGGIHFGNHGKIRGVLKATINGVLVLAFSHSHYCMVLIGIKTIFPSFSSIGRSNANEAEMETNGLIFTNKHQALA